MFEMALFLVAWVLVGWFAATLASAAPDDPEPPGPAGEALKALGGVARSGRATRLGSRGGIMTRFFGRRPVLAPVKSRAR
jgi:hypothetical protein